MYAFVEPSVVAFDSLLCLALYSSCSPCKSDLESMFPSKWLSSYRKQPLQWNVMRTTFHTFAANTTFPQRKRLLNLTMLRFLRKHQFGRFLACSSCKDCELPVIVEILLSMWYSCSGWWVYLTKNTMGSKMYPPGTNHFDPDSPLFKPEQREQSHWHRDLLTNSISLGNSIIISNVALTAMLTAMAYVGPTLVLKYYLAPYLVCIPS